MKRKLSLIGIATLGLLSARLNTPAQNMPIEQGPFYGPWQCGTPGSGSGGTLSYPTRTVCVGESFAPPTLATSPVFVSGSMKREITYTGGRPSQWQTMPLRYFAGSLQFAGISPTSGSIPPSYAAAGTYTYNAYVEATPMSLVGWWPGDGTTAERVYNNNGVLVNGATYAPGKVGQGFSFDGTNDYVSVPDSPYLNFGADNDFSIECWMQVPSGAWGSRVIATKADYGRGFFFWKIGSSLGLMIFTSSGTCEYVASCYPSDQAFHHVAVTVDRDSTTGLIFYVDGQAFGPFDPTQARGDMSTTEENLRIGSGSESTGGGKFKGIIDDFSLYQCALTASDIAAIYTAGSAGKQWNNAPANAAPLPPGCVCSAPQVSLGTVSIHALADDNRDGRPDWFVDTAGNNAYNGHAPLWDGDNGPFATINHALPSVLAGDTLNIAGGTYSEDVDLRGKNAQVLLTGNVTLH